MEWMEVSIYTTSEGIEPVTGSLLQLGINGFVIEDSNDFAEFLESATPHWDYVDESLLRLRDCETCVKLYLAGNEQGAEQLAGVRHELSRLRALDAQGRWGRLELDLGSVREEDWANNWKQYFKPLAIGERLLIKPTWEEVNDPQGRTVLEIDPGASFGTGQHNTTRLCLELLEKAVHPGDRVLDMGCGSGILSIAALLMGAGSALGVDIDQNAVRVARENARQNHIARERLALCCGDVIGDAAFRRGLGAGYDLITANIVADVLIAMSPLFPEFLRPGGELIASGIIEGRYGEVEEALRAQGFQLAGKLELGDWVALVCRKPV